MAENSKCVHCGAGNGNHPILWNELAFCCNGCKTVYELLNDNKLYKYYEIEEQPGIREKDPSAENKYAFLDKEEVQAQIFDFQEGGVAKAVLKIPAIHCASCIWLLEHLNKLDKGVLSSTVHFAKKEITIVFSSEKTSLRNIAEVLNSIHYAPEIELNKTKGKEKSKAHKLSLYKLGVAGFVFANVMLYSLPEYFNGKELEGNLSFFLSLISYILVVPVVFFSGNDYFKSAYKNIVQKQISIDLPIALGISMLFLVTSFELFWQTGQGYADSLAGLIFFLLLGKWYQSKTYEALSFERDYKSYFPVAVTRTTEGKEESILLNEVMKDDELIIRSKELIPADAELIEGDGMIDYSFVTGESAPVAKKKGEFIYAGGRQTGGIIRIKVKKEVEQSRLTQLWNQSETSNDSNQDIQNHTDRISKYFTIVIITLATLGFITWTALGELNTAFYVFTSVLIVACPCALALSVPFTFGNTMQVFGKKGMYIKNLHVIEKLTRITTVIFDKTGTITYPDQSKINFIGENLTRSQKEMVLATVKQSTHPLSLVITDFLADYEYKAPSSFVEMSGRGVFAKIGDTDVKIGSEEFVGGKTSGEKKSSEVYVSINDDVLGFYSISNQYREGFRELISKLKNKFNIYLLSGDNENERKKLEEYFPSENMKFNCSPADKKEYIRKLQEQGENTLMTGDGLNDAGALMQSNVALSVADDVYHFSPAGDAILEASKLEKLDDFIQFSKKALKIVKLSFIISLCYNFIGITIALSGNLSPVIAAILMPASSVTVVAFATFSVRGAGRRL